MFHGSHNRSNYSYYYIPNSETRSSLNKNAENGTGTDRGIFVSPLVSLLQASGLQSIFWDPQANWKTPVGGSHVASWFDDAGKYLFGS